MRKMLKNERISDGDRKKQEEIRQKSEDRNIKRK